MKGVLTISLFSHDPVDLNVFFDSDPPCWEVAVPCSAPSFYIGGSQPPRAPYDASETEEHEYDAAYGEMVG